jgi:hypothetical protein
MGNFDDARNVGEETRRCRKSCPESELSLGSDMPRARWGCPLEDVGELTVVNQSPLGLRGGRRGSFNEADITDSLDKLFGLDGGLPKATLG